MNAGVERAMNWLKGMADDRGYTEHLAHGGKGDPIEEQEIECASTALKYIESLQAQLAASQRRERAAVEDINSVRMCHTCKHFLREFGMGGIECKIPCVTIRRENFEWRGVKEERE